MMYRYAVDMLEKDLESRKRELSEMRKDGRGDDDAEVKRIEGIAKELDGAVAVLSTEWVKG